MISDSGIVPIRAGFGAASCNNNHMRGKDLPRIVTRRGALNKALNETKGWCRRKRSDLFTQPVEKL